MESMKAIKIGTTRNTLEAEMVIDILNQNDIPSYRQGIGSAGILDIYAGNSTFGEDIFVDEKDVEKARELVENLLTV